MVFWVWCEYVCEKYKSMMCKWDGCSDVLFQVSSCRKHLPFLQATWWGLAGLACSLGSGWYIQNCVEIMRGWMPGRVAVWPIHTLCYCDVARLVCTAQQCSWWVIGPLASCLMGAHLVGYMHVFFDGKLFLFLVCFSDEDGFITLSYYLTVASLHLPALLIANSDSLFWSCSQWRK